MDNHRQHAERDRRGDASREPKTKERWQEPTLTFVEPALKKHGDVATLTAQNGFFGTFSPPPPGD